ncbi:helix-turn-helix domain-containing protein [Sphingomonas sp. LaA6.9]|nr:helix-turn-helix domain-containing protein [Sphingomonas sp. LaA6.9]MCJ8159332.1 helix-turn-helix domain-containing protein [Sphingomonas sp. LaA6.9]
MIDEAQPRPITVRIREACRITGIGRSKLYELIAAGEIEIIVSAVFRPRRSKA